MLERRHLYPAVTLFFCLWMAVWSDDTVIRVGIHTFEPLCSQLADGKPAGMFVEILEHVAASEKWKLQYVFGSFAENLDRLKHNEIDLLLATAYERDAADEFNFGKETVLSTWGQIYTAGDSDIQSLLDLNGLSIGLSRDDPYNREVRNITKRLNITATFVEFGGPDKILEGLESGWIDAGVVDRLYSRGSDRQSHNYRKIPIILAPVELRFAAPRDRGHFILAALDLHLQQMKENPDSLYYQLLEREFGRVERTALPRIVGWTLGIGAILLMLLLGANMVLRRQIQRHTAQIRAQNEALAGEVAMRCQAETALRHSNRLLVNTFGSIHDALIVIDSRDDRILSGNRAATAIFGYSEEQLRKLSPTVLQGLEMDAGEFRRRVEDEIRKDGFFNRQLDMYRQDGSVFNAEVSISPIRDDQEYETLWVMIVRDISEKIESDRALRESKDRLQMAQKMEALGTLAGGIAHDFNNILVPILGYAQMIKMTMEREGDVRKKQIDQILTAAHRAKALVSQILSFSRKSPRERRPVHVSMVIQEVFNLLRASLPATIKMKLALNSVDDVVHADPTQIHQILMNLCGNAAAAMQTIGGELVVRLDYHRGPILGWCTADDLPPTPHLCMSICDTGEGIHPNILNRIFDPFFTTKKRGEGTGMGLSVAHGIISGLGGAISVETELGRGTTFHVYLPISKVAETIAETTEDTLSASQTVGQHILIVDDEPMITDMLGSFLEDQGYRVTVTVEGAKALELFKAAPDSIDLVITDQTMPGVTGTELAKTMLAMRADLPIIMITGYSELVSEKAARRFGIRHYVPKPFLPSDIARLIREALETRDPANHRPAKKPQPVAYC